ncbi:MAG: DUF4258 domain-containing protein [Bacteroidota bacterium]
MLKKYLPLLLVILAGSLLYYVKSHQRGKTYNPSTENVTVPVNTEAIFSRDTNQLIYSKHARCRMDCRNIDESEVKEILAKGTINYEKIRSDNRGKTYPLEGITHDKQRVRIVVAPKANETEVVTVIDMDTEWDCDCK